MTKTFALAAAAIGLTVSAVPAMAGNDTVKSTSVTSAGLDLSSIEGQEMLDRRVKAAARKVCGVETVSTGSRIKSVSARSCYRKALATSKQQVAGAVADQQRGG